MIWYLSLSSFATFAYLMKAAFKDYVFQLTGARSIRQKESIQDLWSGYGEILRLQLQGGQYPQVIVKWMSGQITAEHPHGWQGGLSHQRKLYSYKVEQHWYQHFASRSQARVPGYLGYTLKGVESLLVLEDLNAAGYPIRLERLNRAQFENCLAWLAQFHASFMGVKPDGLWETGTYWHLETRPQEWEALKDSELKKAAAILDEKLKASPYQTLVHGDAKLANFCFARDGQVAGLDFQYVGGGCGMKDLAYFVSSCLTAQECAEQETAILDVYFAALEQALGYNVNEIEKSWRPLYRVAWADFYRFLKGWSPQHWKVHDYSEKVTREVLHSL